MKIKRDKNDKGFDKFDIILLMVSLLIIYLVISWFTYFGDAWDEAKRLNEEQAASKAQTEQSVENNIVD